VGLQIVWEAPTVDIPGGIRLLETGDPAGRSERVRWFGDVLTSRADDHLIDTNKDGKDVVAK
jgi:hypothetical protein